MPNWLAEFFIVFVSSTRTHVAFFAGIFLFFVIHILANFLSSDVEPTRPVEVFFAAISDMVIDNAREEALFALFSCWIMAIKFYWKDKGKF